MKKLLLVSLLGIILLSGCGKSVENEQEKVYTIEESDAESLVEEAVADAGYTAELFMELEREDIGSFYIYNIKIDDRILSHQLAVDKVSGELFTYYNGEIMDYSEFEAYNSDADESIQWSGEYSSGEHTLTIEENEPGNFEYHLDGEVGFAMLDTKSKASSEFGGKEIKFSYSKEGITLSGNEDYDGVYVK